LILSRARIALNNFCGLGKVRKNKQSEKSRKNGREILSSQDILIINKKKKVFKYFVGKSVRATKTR